MPVITTQLRAEVFVATTEYELAIPVGTIRMRFSTPGRLPIRLSLNPNEVLFDAGFLLAGPEDTRWLGHTRGPVYYASTQPHALLDCTCFVEERTCIGPAFSSAFSNAFRVAKCPTTDILVTRFQQTLLTRQGHTLEVR